MDAVEFYEIGSNKFAQGNYKEALEAYEKAVEINSNYSEAYRGLGGSHLNLGNYKTAIEYLDKALEINSQDEKAFLNRGLSSYNLDNYLRAAEDFSSAIEINEDYGKAYYIRGKSYYSLKRHEEAIADFTKAIEFGFECSSSFYLRGLAKLTLSNFNGAIKDSTKAIELDPQNYEYYLVRAKAYLFQGIIPALPDFEKVALLSSTNGEVAVAQYTEKVREWIESFPNEYAEPILSNSSSSSNNMSKTENDSKFVVKVTDLKDYVKTNNEFITPKENTRFLAVEVLIDNTNNNEDLVCNKTYFPIKDTKGYQYDNSYSVTIQPSLSSDDIDSGDISRGWITYEIPNDVPVEDLRIRYEFVDDKTAWIKLSETINSTTKK